MERKHFTSYKISKELGLIICNYQGYNTIKHVIDLSKQFLTDTDYNPDFNVMIDFTDSKAIAFRLEVSDYVDFFMKSIKLTKNVKVGSLYSTPNQSFLLKIYKGFGKVMKIEIENFEYFDDYILWMNFNSDQTQQLREILQSIKSNSLEL